MKSQELKCLCYSTLPVGNGSHHEATKIYLLLWPMSCCHERNRGRMSHSPGCGHWNAVWRPAPGWEEADDGVGGRRNEGGAVLTYIRSSTLPELNAAIYRSSCDHLPILSEGTCGDSRLSPWLVQMGQEVFNIQWSVQYLFLLRPLSHSRIWLVGHVITANRACLLLWGLEAVSWVDSRPIVSGSCAQQGQGEMTLVWQWYGSVQCEKVWVQGYYWMAPNTNCTMKLTRLWYTCVKELVEITGDY